MTSSKVFISLLASNSDCFSSLISKSVVLSIFWVSSAGSSLFDEFWTSLSLSCGFLSFSLSLGVFDLLEQFLCKNSSLALAFSSSFRTTSHSLPIYLFSSSLSLEFSSTVKFEKFVTLFLSFFVINPRYSFSQTYR